MVIRPIMTVAVLSTAVALGACRDDAAAPLSEVRPVKVAVVEPAPSVKPLLYSGAVRARIEADLGFRVGGKLTARLVSVGDRVRVGDVVARLDPTDLKLALAAAEANLASAKTRRQVAADALARQRTLLEKGHVSKAVVDQATLEYDAAGAALDAAKSNRDQAANQIRYAELTADTAGVVTRTAGEPGQVVTAGQPVVSIAADGEKEVAFAVPETEIRHVQVGDTIPVELWAEPGKKLDGSVREIAGQADAASRTFAVRVSLPDDPRLRLGMTAMVTIEAGLGQPGLRVPVTALTEIGGKPTVWLADPQSSTVQPRAIVLSGVTADGVRVVDGLKPGDLVVTAGTQFLTPGKAVRLPLSVTAAVTAAPPAATN